MQARAPRRRHSLGDSPEVRALMAVLAPKFAAAPHLTPHSAMQALFGLDHKKDCPEVRAALCAGPRVSGFAI